MIKKVLVANRGEIASRIIRTCRKENIRTVAVYSEVDKTAPFVSMADECYLLGSAHPNDSYLNIEKIISIAQKAKVDAIHPGYGFLSENAAFARQCEQEGIIFIGPSSEIINEMGNKISARKIMKEANVPIIPGTDAAVTTIDEAIDEANKIGYPVMLKPPRGGGGMGMQAVDTEEALTKSFASISERAALFFGDGSIFIEKKLNNSRHIEIQLLADQHGNTVHLFDRECSIQRRNQKVIEEAPSTILSENTRLNMCETAVHAAQKLGYTNAGTIEFLVDENEAFYFLEMNTRIQVEHTVTEEITVIDIVEAQLYIANGDKLRVDRETIKKSGHAIEMRIYAEDPKIFYPSPGLISTFQVPIGENIRNETSVTSNYHVTPFYDPMIAKLIVKGSTRDEAISTIKKALLDYKITGIRTNIPLLLDIVDNAHFKLGETTTSFIEQYYLPENFY